MNSTGHGGEIPETTAATSTEPASSTEQWGGITLIEFAVMLFTIFATTLFVGMAQRFVTATGGGYELSAPGRLVACVPAAVAAAWAVTMLVAAWRAASRRSWVVFSTTAVPAAVFCVLAVVLAVGAFSVAPHPGAAADAYAADHDLTRDSATEGIERAEVTFKGADGTTCEVRFEAHGRTLRPIGDCPAG